MYLYKLSEPKGHKYEKKQIGNLRQLSRVTRSTRNVRMCVYICNIYRFLSIFKKFAIAKFRRQLTATTKQPNKLQPNTQHQQTFLSWAYFESHFTCHKSRRGANCLGLLFANRQPHPKHSFWPKFWRL